MINIIEYLEKNKNIKLNSQQVLAINNLFDDILLLAVPGSGKTTVIVSRIANIILNKQIDSKSILTLTFSKDAANYMDIKFNHLFSDIIKSPTKFSTIHSFCYKILSDYSRLYNKNMPINIDTIPFRKKQILKSINKKINNALLSEEDVENLVSNISYVKNMLLNKNEIEDLKFEISNFSSIFNEYKFYNKQNNYMDFDDMLTYSIEILNKCKKLLDIYSKTYNYINIDEAQDTSKAQHQIINMIKKDNNLFMVGDEDQTIYSFRGAYPKGILNFNQYYPNGKILKMEQNYRSNKDIVEKANTLIKYNKNRYDKDMFTANKGESSIEIININDFDLQYKNIIKEIADKKNQNKSIAVIYRYNESVIPIIDTFSKLSIPYKTTQNNTHFFNSFIVKDILSFLAISYNPSHKQHFKQLKFNMYLKYSAMDHIIDNAGTEENLFDVFLNLKGLESYVINRINLYKSNIPKLKNMTPTKALEFIEDNLKYADFLKNKIKKGYNAENIYNKLSIIKSISINYKTIESFLEGLNKLKDNKTQNLENNNINPINLHTVHSSKGLEFDIVILIDLIDGNFPSRYSIKEQAFGNKTFIEEELRLFYVAITRSKSKIIIYKSDKLNNKTIIHSRFIDYLNGKKIQTMDSCEQYENLDSNEFKNKDIKHKFYGLGVIEEVNGDDIIVHFELFGRKILSLNHCIKNNIINLT